ncbi:MAG: response regulator transcription factor [Faecousia sp.]
MIWIVDDDSTIRDIEVYTLNTTGLEAKGFPGGEAMFAALQTEIPELIVLDIMMPGEDGITVLRKLRNHPETREIPIIMATAKGTEMDMISGLDLGADDYLVKPFGIMTLVSRVKAVLRRCGKQSHTLLSAHGIVMDPENHEIWANGQPVALTKKEFSILQLFLQSPGKVYTREALMTQVWGEDYYGETRTVDMHIKTLRQKLGQASGCIQTVVGIGYRMEATP